MIDPGSTCTIINYPTFLELNQLGQQINIQTSGNKTRTYNGSEIRMIGYTILTSYFDTDGKYKANHRVWVTEEKTSNLLGVDFCHTFLKALYFDIPAVELKTSDKGVLSYGSLNNEKEYPQVSKLNAVIIHQPLYIPPKSTFLYKHKCSEQDIFPKGTSFVPNRTTVKTELCFINTICTKNEKQIPLLIENHKNHQVTLNKGIIGFTICDITNNTQKYSIRDCNEFTYSVINKCEELDSCFMLNTTTNTISESTDLTAECIRYINFDEHSIFDANMPIIHTISRDLVLDKGFTASLIKRYPNLKRNILQYFKSIGSENKVDHELIHFQDEYSQQIIYSLVMKEYYNSPPYEASKTCSVFCELQKTLMLDGIRCIAMPKIACGGHPRLWKRIAKELEEHFKHTGITIYVYISGKELQLINNIENRPLTDEHIAEIMELSAGELVEKCKSEDDIATDFSKEAKKICQPKSREQFPIFRSKYQVKELIDKFTTSVHAGQNTHFNKTEFLQKFDFTQTDLTENEFFRLADILLTDNDVYSHHKYDIGRTKQQFNIPLIKNAEFKKQRPSKVPFHLRDKLELLMDELIQAGIIRELDEHDDMNSWFVNPIIILPKKDYVKLVIDARYLNSITDTSNSSWPLEPLQVLITRVNGSYFTSSDLSCAYHQVPLTPETQKLTGFIIGGRQYTYQVGFYGLKPLPNFFSKLMRYAFGPLIKEKKAITYIDDTLLQSNTKEEMFNIIKEYHALLRKANLKAAPDKTMFFLRKVKFLGHVISENTLSPVISRIDDIRNLKTPESKTDVLSVLGAMGFYSNYVINFHIDAKPLYDLTRGDVNFKWEEEHEKVFNILKEKFVHDISLAIPNANYPFHIHADSSNLGTGCILIQQFPDRKRIVSANSRLFDKAEQKMSPQHRELCGIISALQTYEFYLIGSPFPIYLFCNHRPILFLWSRRGQLSHRFFKYQVVLTKFQNLKIIYTEGKNLAFPDLLSRQVPIEEAKKFQIEHKTIPKDINFYTSDLKPVSYSVLHKEDKTNSSNDSYPILAQVQGGTRKVMNISDNDFSISDAPEGFTDSCNAIHNVADYFKFGKYINQIVKLTDSKQSDNTYSEIQEEVNYVELDDSGYNDDEFSDVIDNLVDPTLIHALEKAKEIYKERTKHYTIIESTALHNENVKSDCSDLLTKLTEFAKKAQLDIDTILQEQNKDPVLHIVRKWIESGKEPEHYYMTRQCKALKAYKSIYKLLLLDESYKLLCYNKPNENGSFELKICIPISLFLKCFELAHSNTMSGHRGDASTLNNISRFFYWPGMYKWVTMLIHDCLDCQKNKSKRHDLNEAPLQQWGELETTPFHTIHIDHKGPFRPSSNGKHYCLVVVDSFSRYVQVYAVKSATSDETIKQMEIIQFLPYKSNNDFKKYTRL